MDRVERSTDVHGNAYSLFQTAIDLELQVRSRTEELTAVLRRLEQSNEELRRAKDEAEQANLYKTRFLAAAGHDLLQPLNAARLTVSALQEVQEGAEGVRLSDRVDRALQTIEELLKTLLDISKLDAGVTKPDLKTVALGEMLDGLASDFTPIVAQKGLSFRTVPSRAFVRTDPLLLRRILQNLISNAVRYTPKGGVVVGARRFGRDGVRIVVADSGIGIPATEHEAIFEEFHRGAAPAGDGSAGLGLGLAIVKRMVQALGHKLEFRSIEGRGTVFSVTVPAADPLTTPTPAARERAALKTFGVADAKVLVVENDEAVRAATAHLLSRWSCRVWSARSLSDVVSFAPTGPVPDLILADYHLDNGETGLDAISHVRKHFLRQIPAVIVTANASEDVARRSRTMGCEILQKPVKPAELRALMAHLLG
nr:hybrid sensor histidine kinase/response regulator [Chthonobacter albigriseus]